MEKFNNLSKGKKTGVIAGVFALLVVVGILAGTLLGGQTKQVVLNKENLSNLIEKEYSVATLKESQDGKSLEVAINGELEDEDLKTLSKNLNEKNVSAGWNKEVITVNVFSKDSKAVDKNKFYVDGLMYRVVLNTEKSNADISEYVSIPAVEKTDALVDYANGSVVSKDGHVELSLDMDLANVKDDVLKVAQQAKTFSILFRETNSDKNIDSMEIKLNPNDNENKFNYHTEFENTVEVINCLPL